MIKNENPFGKFYVNILQFYKIIIVLIVITLFEKKNNKIFDMLSAIKL